MQKGMPELRFNQHSWNKGKIPIPSASSLSSSQTQNIASGSLECYCCIVITCNADTDQMYNTSTAKFQSQKDHNSWVQRYLWWTLRSMLILVTFQRQICYFLSHLLEWDFLTLIPALICSHWETWSLVSPTESTFTWPYTCSIEILGEFVHICWYCSTDHPKLRTPTYSL